MNITKIFDNAKIYQFTQNLLIRKKSHGVISDKIIQPLSAKKVLDFGCGIGYHSLLFPEANYVGLDPLEDCIKLANSSFQASRNTFIVGDEGTLKDFASGTYDLVIAIGVLHHINDETVVKFALEARRLLKPGGRLVTLDPVYHDRQSWSSSKIVGMDRGKFVRSYSDYAKLLKAGFPNLNHRIYSKLLRIPYDHISFSSQV